MIPSLTIADLGEYKLTAANTCGTRFAATANVMESGQPSVVREPTAASDLCFGDTILMSTTAGGVGPFTYQWYKDAQPIAGATSATLLIANINADDAGDYFCEISNNCATIATTTVTQTILPTPEFTSQSDNTCAAPGSTVDLSAPATSTETIFYQWRRGSPQGQVVQDFSADPYFSIVNAQPSDSDDYFVLAVTVPSTCISISETINVFIGGCTCLTPGDMDGDNDHDLADLQVFMTCFGETDPLPGGCLCANVASIDNTINSTDWIAMFSLMTGPQ